MKIVAAVLTRRISSAPQPLNISSGCFSAYRTYVERVVPFKDA